MFIIEAIHPNEINKLRWNAVCKFSVENDFRDHLASPDFEWYPGMVVRVIDVSDNKFIYTGIFGENRCIDAGYGSKMFSKNNRRGTYYRSNPEISFVEYWKYCTDAMEFIDTMTTSVSRKTKIRMMMPCVESVLPHDSRIYADAIELVRGWLEDRVPLSQIQSQYSRCGDGVLTSSNQYASASVCTFLATVLGNNLSSTVIDNIFMSKIVSKEKFHQEACEMMRNAVPFYDIALDVCSLSK